MPAIAVHHTATVDEPWDGPDAVAAMPNDDAVLRYCHAWQTPEAADADHKSDDDDVDDQKGSYKFPHAKSKGAPANLAACRNGLARVDGSSIPDADKAGVKAHLQAHIDDAEKKTDDAMTGTLTALAAYGSMSNEQRIRAHLPRAQRLSASTDWFRITAAAAGTGSTRLDLYDEIGFWGVTASDFRSAMDGITTDTIDMHINSPGGDVFDGIAILNLLRAHPAAVNVTIDGLAASAASFIAMAGDTVTMMPNSEMMIHDASGLCIGNSTDMDDMSALLGRVSNNIASIYASRAGGTAADWRTTMQGEQWYSADEAVAAGLADTVVELPAKKTANAAAAWNLNFYAYDGRRGAPPPPAPAPQPAPQAAAPVFMFDPQQLRDAMKEAANQ